MDISYYLLLCFFAFQSVSSKSLRHDSSSSYSRSTISYYSRVTIADPANTHTVNGLLASYSNISVSSVKGAFFEPGDAFDAISCVTILNKRRSPVYPPYNLTIPRGPFVLVLKLTDCDHYSQARFAQELGAVGVLFHAPESRNSFTTYQSTSLDVVVAFLKVEDDAFSRYKNMLKIANATVTLEVEMLTTTYHTSRTFYFVVFAFSVLVLLSLAWFSITYIRRCHYHCSRRYNRRRERRATSRAMSALPTKKHKVAKNDDSVSINSADEPTCAICLENFKHNEIIRPLPCSHEFHKKCIDPWLQSKGNCPLCKLSILKRQTTATVSLSNSVHPTDDQEITAASVAELMTQDSTTELIPMAEQEEEGGANDPVSTMEATTSEASNNVPH